MMFMMMLLLMMMISESGVRFSFFSFCSTELFNNAAMIMQKEFPNYSHATEILGDTITSQRRKTSFSSRSFLMQTAPVWSWISCILHSAFFMTSALPPNQARPGKHGMGLPGGQCRVRDGHRPDGSTKCTRQHRGWLAPSTVNRLLHVIASSWLFNFRAARHLLIVMHTSLLSFVGMPGIAVQASSDKSAPFTGLCVKCMGINSTQMCFATQPLSHLVESFLPPES